MRGRPASARSGPRKPSQVTSPSPEVHGRHGAGRLRLARSLTPSPPARPIFSEGLLPSRISSHNALGNQREKKMNENRTKSYNPEMR